MYITKNSEEFGLDYFEAMSKQEQWTKTYENVFDPVLFRENAEFVIAKLENHLADSTMRGLALTKPETLLQTAKELMQSVQQGNFPITDKKKLGEIIDLYLKTGIQVHSTGYMGRQFSSVIPLAGVFDLVNSIVNQPSSFYEAAQLPNVVEKIMADEFNQFIGWQADEFAMITTSGGSLANLTAILAARNDKFPQFWSEGVLGVTAQARPAIAVGDDVHYSISRAAGILGIGEGQIIRLPLNAEKQICIEQVRPTLEAAAKRGLQVFCLVASAGTTSTGAFDSIDELADIAAEQNFWLHIDGAHGGGFLVSDKLRYKLKGIERVDSFALDAHKMLFVPAMCTLLFYKDKAKSYGAFQQKASYVFEKQPDIYTEYDSAEQNFECTKRPLIMNLWVLWTLYGRQVFADKLEYLCQLTTHAYDLLKNTSDFQVLHKPQANILCFRYLPDNIDDNHFADFQVTIRNRIREAGKFFISKVDIDGAGALRVVFMNHEITTQHFQLLLNEIRQIGQDLLKHQ